MEQKLSQSKVNKKHFLRELIFKSLYAAELGSEVDEQLFEMIAKDIIKRSQKQVVLEDDDRRYIKHKVDIILDNKQDIDIVIESFLSGWKMDRLSVVDLCILRMSVYDLLYNDDVPNNVIISEAVLLAQNYSDEKNKKFINGILGAVLKKLKENSYDSKQFISDLKDKLYSANN